MQTVMVLLSGPWPIIQFFKGERQGAGGQGRQLVVTETKLFQCSQGLEIGAIDAGDLIIGQFPASKQDTSEQLS